MATTWAEIDAAAMTPIDDIRLTEQLEISPALYYRRMSLLVSHALGLMTRPPELYAYLTRDMVEPKYTDYLWTSTEESTTSATAVSTGAVGYDICSCVICEQLDDGRILQTAYAVTYDAQTGEVVFPQQSEAGVTYQLDFYKDGSFNTLSEIQLRLFAQAISLVWDERFTDTWLNRTPKINDSSFATVNEANYTEKTSQAHLRKEQAFNDELKHYEQLCAYESVVSAGTKGKVTLV